MKNLLLLLLIGFLMSCGNSEDSPYKNGLTKKTTSKQKVDKPTPEIKSAKNKILVYSVTGDWKVNYGDGEYGDEYSTYEIFYTKSSHKYELVMEGFQPKNHNAYEEVSKLIININNAVLDGHTHKEIRLKYLQ